MLRYLSQLLLLALEITYITSTQRLPTAFTTPGNYYRCSFRLRHDQVTPSSTSRRSSSTDETIDTSWGPADDWENLAIQQNDQNTDNFLSFFQDPARDVARSIEEGLELEAQQQLEHQNQLEEEEKVESARVTAEDEFVSDIVDSIHTKWNPSDPALYDTNESFDKYANSDDFSDDLGKEIGLLVRCNEVPENINVEEGRALPELKDEHKYDVQQLVLKKSSPTTTGDDEDGTNQYEATEFFSIALSKMFQFTTRYSKGRKEGQPPALTKEAVAKWMSRSLGEKIGMYDRRVTATVARYGTAGVIHKDQFTTLYMEATTSDMVEDSVTWKRKESMKRMKLAQPNFMNVWRDLENHGFSPPIVVERQKMQLMIDAEFETKEEVEVGSDNSFSNFMDECEILEWGDNEHSSPRPSSRNKSSHELVEMCSDTKTPKRLRDGDFIFIDEESCIGCNQCVSYAPASFKMEPGGRASTYHQSNSPEVAIGVSACPVSCMHSVSFPELKEMENGRDKGDGRTDHKHLGRRAHTPLNVAKGSSDMNHKSSWYHYLKQKCYMSKSCPQKGCYDCPNFARPGDNPYFQRLHQAAEKIRATEIMKTGELDFYRNVAEL